MNVRAGEGGSASVVVVALAAALLVLLTGIAAAVRLQVDLIRAATAADSAAVAGAAAVVGLVPGPPCSVAATVLARSGITLDECTVTDAEVLVRGSSRSGVVPVGATARAGPDRTSAVYRSAADGGALGHRVCMVCLSDRHSSASTVVTSALCARRPICTIDQGVTCQARRSS